MMGVNYHLPTSIAVAAAMLMVSIMAGFSCCSMSYIFVILRPDSFDELFRTHKTYFLLLFLFLLVLFCC